MITLDQIKALRFRPPPAQTTLEQARNNWDLTIRDKGGHCPCCDRWGKVYRHKVSESMVKSLLWIASNHGENWIDIPRVAPKSVVATYTFATLKWWHLIQPMNLDMSVKVEIDDEGNEKLVREDSEKRSSGLWRVTPLGMQFARGLVQIPKFVYLYNDTLKDVSVETVYIKDCVGEKFNYAEIMNETWGEGSVHED